MKYNLTDPATKKKAEDAEKGFTLMPEGRHLMRCIGATYKVVNDRDAVELSLVVVPGEPAEHQSCRDTLFFSERAIGRVLLVCAALGMKDDWLANVEPDNEECIKQLVGRLAIVDVEHSKPDPKGRVWANPTYAGYHVAHQGSIDEMKREREAGAARPAAGTAGGEDYGKIPF